MAETFPTAQRRAAWRSLAKRNRRLAAHIPHDAGMTLERNALIASAQALEDVCEFLSSVAKEARRG